MDSFFSLFKQYRHGIVASTLLLTAVFLMLSLHTGAIGFRAVQVFLLDVTGPIQQVLLWPREVYRWGAAGVEEWVAVHDENVRLRQELARTRFRRGRLEEALAENSRLRALLGMPMARGYLALTAQVVGSASSAFARSMVLNAGETDGVRMDAVAVAPDGLVGRVVTVGRSHAVVLTLMDLNSRVPVRVQRTRAPGVVTGTNDRSLVMNLDERPPDPMAIDGIATGGNQNLLNLEFVSKKAPVGMGDLVVTSGTGGIFPRGLVVGRVVALNPQGVGLFQKVALAPAVDFDRVEEVQLLLHPLSPGAGATVDGGPTGEGPMPPAARESMGLTGGVAPGR
ncbi:MAG: rod shape-determining protein MreC [Magnetococcales bacterium]|nr:rod shape-determining protein MreC [Magnetococcales bacterium]